MKIEDLRIGMKVKGVGQFGLIYEVIKINKKTCSVTHKTGEKIMQGGKWVDEIFVYNQVNPKLLKEI